jgi:hypothetical protein
MLLRLPYFLCAEEHGGSMPMNFLRRIEHASFPLAVHDETDIQCAAVLAAAELIEVSLPKTSDETGLSGVILRITPIGRAALNRDRQKSS